MATKDICVIHIDGETTHKKGTKFIVLSIDSKDEVTIFNKRHGHHLRVDPNEIQSI